MRIYTLLFTVLIYLAGMDQAFGCSGADTAEAARPASVGLRVSQSGRFLETDAGKPFLYLGDTAWELFHKLDRREAAGYLKNRADKGFTVIQAVILAENDGLRIPNPYGEVPLKDLDPAKPNGAYFEHVDYIVEKAEKLGLYMGVLPTWGDKVTDVSGGAGPVVFDRENARIYGEFLGNRYRDKPVIWILGGDRNVNSLKELEVWRSMANGLRAGDGGRHLITYHPRGAASSAYWLHNEPWLDFNMYQSGHHQPFNPVYEYATASILLRPQKPVVDGEPAYEDIPVQFWEYCDWTEPLRVPPEVLDEDRLIRDRSFFEKGYFDDYDIRVHAYWNLLSGACGYTYGNNAVWQMFKKGGSVAIPCLTDWEEALDRPGAEDMRHLRDLFEMRSFADLVPDQSLIYGKNPQNSGHIRSAISGDRSFAVFYTPEGRTIRAVMHKIDISGAWWFDPRTGKRIIAETPGKEKIMEFIPPTAGRSNDWILVIDGSGPALAGKSH